MAQIKPFQRPIYITRPTLPDRAAVYRKIDEIRDSQWLRNVGPQHREFEKELKKYLDVPNFHANKIYETLKSGALTFKDEKLRERLEFAKNFGFKGEEKMVVPGTNDKMNEFQVAIGLLMLELVGEEIEKKNI